MNSKPAASDYLWDPSSAPDSQDRVAADTQHLESVLAAFRPSTSSALEETADTLAHTFRARRWSELLRISFLNVRPQLAFAAVAVLLIAGIYFAWNVPGPAGSSWSVARISGSPRVGKTPITDRTELHLGQTLSTDAASQARIEVEDLGEISVAQDSRVRLLAAGSATGTLSLDQGTIHAMIWAPPRRFTVRTPGADAIDLGCSYTLHVSPDGEGWLRVSTGWVAFTDPRAGGRESFVPVGAMCLLKPRLSSAQVSVAQSQSGDSSESSIGTPFYEDASASFREALEHFDFDHPSAGHISSAITLEVRSKPLSILLDEARPRDALTLWHLLARTNLAERAAVYDRLSALIPPPNGVVRETLLTDDPALAGQRRGMRDLWWNALGLRDTEWWRYWERPSPPR